MKDLPENKGEIDSNQINIIITENKRKTPFEIETPGIGNVGNSSFDDSKRKRGIRKKLCLQAITLIMYLFLFFPLIPTFRILYSPIYFIPMIIMTMIVSYISIPCFTDYIYKKSTKFEDLIDNSQPTREQKNKLLYYHRLSIIILSSFMGSIVVYYIFFEMKFSNLSLIESLSVPGSYLSYYWKCQNISSRFLKELLYNWKRNRKGSIPRPISKETLNVPNII